MDEQQNQQQQNPYPSGSLPMNQQVVDHAAKHKSHWALVAVVILLLAVFLVAWWYIKNMEEEAIIPVIQPRPLNTPVPEEVMIENEVIEVDLGDIDAEFNDIDAELNTL